VVTILSKEVAGGFCDTSFAPGGKFFCGEQFCFADVALYDCFDSILSLPCFDKEQELAALPKLKEFLRSFEAIPALATYFSEMRSTPMESGLIIKEAKREVNTSYVSALLRG